MINLMRPIRINDNISVLIVRLGTFHPYALMPTMHSTYRIRVNRESKILMYAAFLPEDSL
jgi:hypothetical protein